MDFWTQNFELTCVNLHHKLGLEKEVEIDYWKSSNRISEINWQVDFDKREWGIKSIDTYAIFLNIWIEWEISLSDLDYDEIEMLLQHETKEFYPTYYGENTVKGTIKINQNLYEINNNITVKNDSLTIEEVYIDFKEEQITII